MNRSIAPQAIAAYKSIPSSRQRVGRRVAALLFAIAWAIPPMVVSTPAGAQHDASIFREADLALGEKLIEENRCAACHIKKFGGDGTAIYRPQGRISTAGFLRGMVEQCNTELKMQLFPEEVTAIAAVLNRDFYRFK